MKKFSLLLTTIYLLSSSCFANDEGQLSIRGNATIYKPADHLRISLGVVTQSEDAATALSENSEKITKVIETLKNLNLQEGEYKTGFFQIQPLYKQNKSYESDFNQIVGYKVTNSLEIQTEHIQLTGQIIDATIKAGANKVENIQFSLKDDSKYKAEVIALATQEAINEAKILAQAAGVRLGRILLLSLDGANTTPLNRTSFFKAAALDSVPIEAGNVELRADVSIQYEILDK